MVFKKGKNPNCNYKHKICEFCNKEYKPNSSIQKRCSKECSKIFLKNKYKRPTERGKWIRTPEQNKNNSERGKLLIKGKNPFFGKHHSKETKRLMVINHKGMSGKSQKEQTRKKMRISTLRYLEKKGFTSPRVGKYEKEILDKLQEILGFSIKRNFFIDGYYLDGYCQELNLAIEIDEDYHYNIYGILKEKDIVRQKRIIELLNCKFLRVRERDYIKKMENIYGIY